MHVKSLMKRTELNKMKTVKSINPKLKNINTPIYNAITECILRYKANTNKTQTEQKIIQAVTHWDHSFSSELLTIAKTHLECAVYGGGHYLIDYDYSRVVDGECTHLLIVNIFTGDIITTTAIESCGRPQIMGMLRHDNSIFGLSFVCDELEKKVLG